ncbi:hypothetical protein DL98DRAFT_539825 [Cadophora sp. DSE1049]|nr:hypothetical protein DL98DRAFT_539825 [Cadophora sp. DSE1049]
MASEQTLKQYGRISNESIEKDIADQRATQAEYRKILESPDILSNTEADIADLRRDIVEIDRNVKEMEAELARRKKGKQNSGSGGFDDSGLGSSGLGDEPSPRRKPNTSSSSAKASGQPADEFNESRIFSSTGLSNTSSGPSNNNEAEGLFVPKPNFQATGDESEDEFVSVQGGEASSGADNESEPSVTPENGASEDAGLFTSEQADKAAGRWSDGVVTHWRKQGNANHVIVRYGPPTARKYTHTTSSRAGKNFDKKNTPKFGPTFRYGDKKDEDGNHLRSRDEFLGFLAEAYPGDVEGLRPKKTWTDKKGKKRVEKRKFPITDLYVLWLIEGELKRAWETRSSIKHLWTSPGECDKDIYNSAKLHAAEHQKWLDTQDRRTVEDSDEGDEDGDEESDEGDDDSDEDGHKNRSGEGSDEDDDGDGSDIARSNVKKTRSPRNKGKGKEAKGKEAKGNDGKGTGNQKKGTKTNKKNNTAADDEDDDIKQML